MPTTTDAGLRSDGLILSSYFSIRSKSLFIPGDFFKSLTEGGFFSTADSMRFL